MNYLDSLKVNDFKNDTGINLKAQTINALRFYLPPQTTVFPKMPVPAKLWFERTNSRIEFSEERHKIRDYEPPRYRLPDIITRPAFIIYVPKVDKIINDYIKEQLPVIYTLKAMRFDSARSGYKSSASESDKVGVGYSLDILKALKKESAGEVNLEYENNGKKHFLFMSIRRIFTSWNKNPDN